MPPQTPDVQSVIADSDFQGLPLSEKHKVLLEIDPDYKGLPPQEQQKALEQIGYPNPVPGTGSPKGVLERGAGVLGRQISGLASSAVAPVKSAVKGYESARERGHGVLASAGIGAVDAAVTATPGFSEAASVASQPSYKDERAKGYGRTYSALAPTVASTVGVNLPEMERGAASGDTNKVLAEAAVPAGEAGAGYATKGLAPLIEDARAPKRIAAAKGQLMDFLKPTPGKGGMNAAQMERDVTNAVDKGHLSEIFREEPGKHQPIEGKGSDAVGHIIDRIDQYQDKLWDTAHKEPLARQGKAPFNYDTALKNTLSEITPEDYRTAKPGQILQAKNAVTRLFAPDADGKPLTLDGADKLVRRLNDEIKNPPDAWGAVGARVRMRALKELRQGIDDGLISRGEVGVKASNQSWGSLENIKTRLAERYVQTWQKEAATPRIPSWMRVYAFIHTHGVSEGLSIHPSGLLEPSEASKLVGTMKQLGRENLRPPSTAPRARKGMPQLPAKGETSAPNPQSDPTLGKAAPGGPRTKLPAREVGESGGARSEFRSPKRSPNLGVSSARETPGKLAKAPGQQYRTPDVNVIKEGTATPEVALKHNQPASSLPLVDRWATARGKLQQIIDDPLETQSRKVEARRQMKLLARTTRGMPSPPEPPE